ncbi:MAG: hypothetical protein HYZ42_11095 [Bacteroidetes bacterium]|nr:hypothetical protein [Bacteroidota bacterium]
MRNALKKALLIISIFALTAVSAKSQETAIIVTTPNNESQNYNTAIGLRLGGLASGLTAKQFISGGAAVEGILGFGSNGFIITGLYEQHLPISGAAGLQWLYGGGAHIGFFSDRGKYYYTFNGDDVYYTRAAIIGIDGIIGLDYKFKGAPVNIGLDIKPVFDFTDGMYLFFDTGLSARVAF